MDIITGHRTITLPAHSEIGRHQIGRKGTASALDTGDRKKTKFL